MITFKHICNRLNINATFHSLRYNFVALTTIQIYLDIIDSVDEKMEASGY